MKENLHKIGNNNKITIEAGDFNFDLLKYDYNNLTNDFLSIMYFKNQLELHEITGQVF